MENIFGKNSTEGNNKSTTNNIVWFYYAIVLFSSARFPPIDESPFSSSPPLPARTFAGFFSPLAFLPRPRTQDSKRRLEPRYRGIWKYTTLYVAVRQGVERKKNFCGSSPPHSSVPSSVKTDWVGPVTPGVNGGRTQFRGGEVLLPSSREFLSNRRSLRQTPFARKGGRTHTRFPSFLLHVSKYGNERRRRARTRRRRC